MSTRTQRPNGDRDTGIACPITACPGTIVYNGNYFCDRLMSGACDWAMEHPVIPAERELFKQLLGRYPEPGE